MCGESSDGDHGRRQLLRLGLSQTGFEERDHAREPQLAKGPIEFDQIHSESPALRSMRSR
jgi:hypothetical protein